VVFYTNEKCNSRTYSANRSRIITIKKTGGLKGCTFPKRQNESIIDNTKGIFLDDKFQFSSNNDNINATFDVKETENMNLSEPNSNLCTCEVPFSNWKPLSQCPPKNNTFLPDSSFNIIEEGTCPGKNYLKTFRTITCSRDCSGNWSNWSLCDAVCPGNSSEYNEHKSDGIQKRTFTIINKQLGEGKHCTQNIIETKNCKIPCIDCYGNWSDWSDCIVNINQCDLHTEMISGIQTRNYTIFKNKVLGGKSCDYTNGQKETTHCNKYCRCWCTRDFEYCHGDCDGLIDDDDSH